MVPWRRRRETSSSSQLFSAPILNLPHEMWLCIQHFLPSSDCLAVSNTCRTLRSFLYPVIFRQITISLAPSPSSASLDALAKSPVPQFVHTLRIVRDPHKETVWLALAALPTFQRLFRRLINVRNIVLTDLNTSSPDYLPEWMFKNKLLECIAFKGLNDGKFDNDCRSQVSVQYEPPGDRQTYFLDTAPITRLRISWSHLLALMQSSKGPSFERLTVLSITTNVYRSVLEAFSMLRYFPMLQKLHLLGGMIHQRMQGSKDLLGELAEMAKTALPFLQDVTTTSYDFFTTLLLHKRPLRRVELHRIICSDINGLISNLLRTTHSTMEVLCFRCPVDKFLLLEKIHLFKSLRSLSVNIVHYTFQPIVIPESFPRLPETLTELHIECTFPDRSIKPENGEDDLYTLRGQLFELLQHLQSATLLLHQVFIIFRPDFRRPVLYRCTRLADREWAIRELNQRPPKAQCRAISLLNDYTIGPRTVEPGSDFDWYHISWYIRENW